MTAALSAIAAAVRRAPNKGRMHVFLGHPASDTCDKTTVEPGNAFSPGLWTCGISLWVETQDGRLWTPDLLPDDAVCWGFSDDGPSALEASWPAGEGLSVSSRLCHLGGPGAEGVDFCTATLSATTVTEGTCFLVVRDAGPAGAKIERLDWDADARTLQVGGGPRVTVEAAPESAHVVPADDQHESPLALLRFPFALGPGETWTLSFKAEHGFSGRAGAWLVPLHKPHAALSVAQGMSAAGLDWAQSLPGRIHCPDPRLARVWDRSAYHLLAAMEDNQPRIGVANYPAFWMRDGVLVLRALDVLGRTDLGRIGCEALAPLLFSGGFGAEADAPGEGIWALVSHALITQDTAWLAPHFGQIERRAAWLERMMDADAPLRCAGENRLPAYLDTPGINLVCAPARDGLIRGRMDWHGPDFYINCWAVAGFRSAALAAELLGLGDKHRAWPARADALEAALAEHLLPSYGNERDPAVTPHPTGALWGHADSLRARFESWFRAHRLTPEGARVAEPLWTYFEVAQVHNAFRLGLDSLAWAPLDGLLDGGGTACWDVSAWGEGEPGGSEYLPFRNGAGQRGWLDPSAAMAGNMPHGWTAAEWVLLLRDLFVRDDGDRLRLAPHRPAEWRRPGARFGVRNLPTRFGPVSYEALVGNDGAVSLEYEGPPEYEAPGKVSGETHVTHA